MQLFNPTVNGSIGHGGTFNANPLTMATGLATMKELNRETFKRLEADTQYFTEELRKVFKQEGIAVKILQIGSLFCVHMTEEEMRTPEDAEAKVNHKRRVMFHLGLANRGILIAPKGVGCLSTVMTREDLKEAIQRVHQTLIDLKQEKEFNQVAKL